MIRGCEWCPGTLTSLARSGQRARVRCCASYSRRWFLLQEVNPASAGILRQAAGADWDGLRYELPGAAPGRAPARCRVTAVAGYGLPDPHHRALLEGLQPWRTLAVAATIGGAEVFAASYHAPPGVSYGIAKPRQAVAVALLAGGPPRTGPVRSRRQHTAGRCRRLRGHAHPLAYRRPSP